MFEPLDRTLTGRPWLAWVLLTVFCAALWLPGVATIPATDRDEARFVQASRQMMESGDYVDIRFQDTPRYKKPVGIYWMQVAAVRLLGGEDPANPVWHYRIPSLLGLLTAVLATWALGRRLFGAGAGFVAAALLASAMLPSIEAHLAKTDAVLLGCCAVAMAALARIYDPERATPRTALVFWLAMGIGTLVKGPMIVIVVAIAIVSLLVIDRRGGWLTDLRWRWGLPLYVLLVLPWFAAIVFASHGTYLQESVGVDLLPKLLGSQESHGAPPLTYFLSLPITLWPGCALVLLGLAWGWRNRHDRDVRFLLAWFVPGWIIFELVPTKLPHYPLPFDPALMLLAAAWFAAERNTPPTRSYWRDAALAFATFGGLLVGAVLIAAGPLTDGRVQPAGIAAGIAAIATSWFIARWIRRGFRDRALLVALAGPLLVYPLAWGLALPDLQDLLVSQRLARALPPGTAAEHVFLAGYHEPSAVVQIGTKVNLANPEEAAAALADNSANIAVIDARFEQQFHDALTAKNVTATAIGKIDGYNYTVGKRVALTLWRRS